MSKFMPLFVVCAAGAIASASSPWAEEVVSYDPGSAAGSGFTNSSVVLGSPTRFTSPDAPFPGAVTPFQSAYSPNEIVSVGEGGHLTIRFGQAVRNRASNPFGIDLLVFGNSFFTIDNFPDGRVNGLFGGRGVIEVSADGEHFFEIPGVDADGLFPTLGYSDVTAFQDTPGGVLTDFRLPVDPAFDPMGKTFEELVAGYNGSGGGAGVDIGLAGLEEILYVRVSNPLGSGVTANIDGFSITIPSPAGLTLAGLGLTLAARRRR